MVKSQRLSDGKQNQLKSVKFRFELLEITNLIGRKNEKIRPVADLLQERMESELAIPGGIRHHRHYHH